MISKTAEYALRAVASLAAKQPGASSANELAGQTNIPRRYLHRVLQDLIESELVRSRPGPGGGYELVEEADKVTILDVINAVDPIERIRSCPLGLPSHTDLCPLHKELDQAYAATEAAFRNVTIRQLLDSATSIIPLCDTSPEAE